jgi:hypothetical protein
MERNLHETTSRWKTYGKRLLSEDLEVQDEVLNQRFESCKNYYALKLVLNHMLTREFMNF